MPERPLLIFPEPTVEDRRRPPGGGGPLFKPSAAQQRKRLDAKFRSIAQSFQSLQTTTEGVEPEQVIVLETIGTSVDGLAGAAEQVPGAELRGPAVQQPDADPPADGHIERVPVDHPLDRGPGGPAQ